MVHLVPHCLEAQLPPEQNKQWMYLNVEDARVKVHSEGQTFSVQVNVSEVFQGK